MSLPKEKFDTAAITTDIDAACARIAPTWPLDQFIAVNPFWGYLEQTVPAMSARLAALCGSRLLMPRAWYRAQWREGRLQRRHLRLAIERFGAPCAIEQLTALLESAESAHPRRAVVTDVVDASRDNVHHMSWCDFVTHSISQFCAAYFDDGQAQLVPDRDLGLYPTWRRQAERDLSPALLMGLRSHREAVRRLPTDPQALIAEALATLRIPAAERQAYFTSLLLRINGWAAWCAYRRWQARLAGGDDDAIVHLLALRLAWELLLYRANGDGAIATAWQTAMAQWTAIDGVAEVAQGMDWLLQAAMEIAYQEPLCRALVNPAAAPSPATPAVQAVFCIDVRSEVFRRALEATSPAVETLGFAGFFGLPIAYRPLAAGNARPQLPGLLAPRMLATDTAAPADLEQRRALRLDLSSAWKQFRTAAISGFSFVETVGLFYAGRLISDSIGHGRPVAHPESAGLTDAEHACRKPRLTSMTDGSAVGIEARTDLAATILRAMSLTSGFARLVLLAGHGSETVNNPHAAGLDCGACCGQTGEVNARAVAALLNDAAVRTGLPARGIRLPASTWFVPGLHNTTTDEVDLFDLDEVPASHREDLATLRTWLQQAGGRARSERAATLGLANVDGPALHESIRRRARDWSQVRPEWGLVNNAAFIVAPRERSRHIDLQGRSFLHEYRWQQDANFSVLELIMTAPMVVTHWINFQYYASTVDNQRWGSGNKVLHNVVGGHVGVFEGNGGDLRIGLPMQSLHDGRQWIHTPLRLSVFIEAPREAMDDILQRHAHVRQLVENGWLHLFQIDAAEGCVYRRSPEGWTQAATDVEG